MQPNKKWYKNTQISVNLNNAVDKFVRSAENINELHNSAKKSVWNVSLTR